MLSLCFLLSILIVIISNEECYFTYTIIDIFRLPNIRILLYKGNSSYSIKRNNLHNKYIYLIMIVKINKW